MRILPSPRPAFEATESELVAMTSDLEEAHRDSLPALTASFESLQGERDERGFSRRHFLTRSGLLAAGGLLVASTGAAASSASPRVVAGRSLSSPQVAAPLDVTVAALAASLENLAVSTYSSALAAAKAGKIGTVPAAVATFISTALAQHKDHAAAWNAIISSAGYRPVTVANAALAGSVNTSLAKATDVASVAKLALSPGGDRGRHLPRGDRGGLRSRSDLNRSDDSPRRDAARRDPQLRPRPVSGARCLRIDGLAAKVADAPKVTKS